MDLSYLVKQIKEPSSGLRLRQGLVMTVNSDNTIDVQIAGDTNTLPKVKFLGNVAPLPGYSIWIITNGSDMLALGSISSSTANATLAPTATRSTNQSITQNVETKVIFDAANGDYWGCWSSGSPTRLTVPVTGRYMVTATFAFAADNQGIRQGTIILNNTTNLVVNNRSAISNSIDTHGQLISPAVTLTQGNYVELSVYHTSTAALNLDGSAGHFPNLSLVYLGS